MAKQNGNELLLKIAESPSLVRELRRNPRSFFHLCNFKDFSIFSDPQVFETLAHNFLMRQETFRERGDAIRVRLESKPLADEQELQMGVYREQLEPQVRNAVVELMRKGYLLFESGFYELTNGSQYIGIEKKADLKLEAPPSLIAWIEEKGISINIIQKETIMQMVLTPKLGNLLDIKDWKIIWDMVAQELPVVKKPQGRSDPSGDFLNRQRKIKSGEKVFLGQYTDRKIWIENGHVTAEEG